MIRKMDSYSPLQIFVVIFLFLEGTAILINLAPDLGRDAWIATLFCTFIGMFLIWWFFFLLRNTNQKNIYGVFQQALGKIGGSIVGVVYITYFIYICARDMRDFSELITNAVLPSVPLEWTTLCFAATVIYVLWSGVQNFLNLFVLFGYVFAAIFIVFLVLVIADGELDFHNLLPIMGDGIGPMLPSTFTQVLEFPFGELIAFTAFAGMLYPNLSGKVMRASLLSVLAAGIILTVTLILELVTFGPSIRERAMFPLVSASRNISIGNFIERIEMIVIFAILLAAIVKVCIFAYAALQGVVWYTGKSYTSLIIPYVLLTAEISYYVSNNMSDHIMVGLSFVPIYIHIPLQFAVPAILLVFIKMRSRWRKRNDQTAV
ncbi:GerAB/ArcD/ProY family transporter [Paenibacillus sp. JDR-2]|uniref:GerAB/ArcD/ProY family transporter n=1 Tax=Paenibacillus sp. (strain JDR-2) TaxID=324057 RepID=UPI0001AAF870|nr:GerAB/ArcD/ProY family transporter [Paenibacillus sp. JDR-2]ACT01614.1 spore germination protein [Paenibacillus sp. JDR-2]